MASTVVDVATGVVASVDTELCTVPSCCGLVVITVVVAAVYGVLGMDWSSMNLVMVNYL